MKNEWLDRQKRTGEYEGTIASELWPYVFNFKEALKFNGKMQEASPSKDKSIQEHTEVPPEMDLNQQPVMTALSMGRRASQNAKRSHDAYIKENFITTKDYHNLVSKVQKLQERVDAMTEQQNKDNLHICTLEEKIGQPTQVKRSWMTF